MIMHSRDEIAQILLGYVKDAYKSSRVKGIAKYCEQFGVNYAALLSSLNRGRIGPVVENDLRKIPLTPSRSKLRDRYLSLHSAHRGRLRTPLVLFLNTIAYVNELKSREEIAAYIGIPNASLNKFYAADYIISKHNYETLSKLELNVTQRFMLAELRHTHLDENFRRVNPKY